MATTEHQREANRLNAKNYRERHHERCLQEARDRHERAKEQDQLTQARLQEVLRYDQDTGVFTYRAARGRFPAGFVAGTFANGFGFVLTLDGIKYSAGRLAWLYMTGEWPEHRVFHDDGDTRNNSWGNLTDKPPKVTGLRAAAGNGLWSAWK